MKGEIEIECESAKFNIAHVSTMSLRVLNYVKKHNCRIRMRWYCGIQVHRVWKDDKELSYPHINEEIWFEISKFFKQYGYYSRTHFYNLTKKSFSQFKK